ncbi:MAG: hypothetical protein WC726_02955 [Parcubacteria group bacterium]|jgi:hypothetical protein
MTELKDAGFDPDKTGEVPLPEHEHPKSEQRVPLFDPDATKAYEVKALGLSITIDKREEDPQFIYDVTITNAAGETKKVRYPENHLVALLESGMTLQQAGFRPGDKVFGKSKDEKDVLYRIVGSVKDSDDILLEEFNMQGENIGYLQVRRKDFYELNSPATKKLQDTVLDLLGS